MELLVAFTLLNSVGQKTETVCHLHVGLKLFEFKANSRAGEYKGIAMCVDVRVDASDGSGKTDAIRVMVG